MADLSHSELVADLDRLENPFDLTADGLGAELAGIAAEEILANMDAETDPDGNPWPSLSAGYREWKDVVAPGAPMAVLRGVMKTIEQLRGEPVFTPGAGRQTYGTDDEAKEHAMKFQEGGLVTGTNQPQRPFYGFTQKAFDRMNAACDQRFVKATS